MLLTNFLQLIDDLNIQTTFFIKDREKLYPLSKIALTSSFCEFYSGTHPLTKKKIIKLVGKSRKGVPLKVIVEDHEVPFYGIQISLKDGKAILR